MTINKLDLNDGYTMYIFIENWVRDGSGDGELMISHSLEHALYKATDKIYKVTLEELKTEEITEEVTVTRKRKIIKNDKN